MSEFEIIFYEKEDGTMPAQDFLDSLDDKMRAKMILTVDMLKNKGNRLREPYSKPLDDGIMELRAVVGTNISRVLYFFVVGQKVILTNGFIKKTQKTPKKEITLAQKYREDYIARERKKQEEEKKDDQLR
jgi:phage-related protein